MFLLKIIKNATFSSDEEPFHNYGDEENKEANISKSKGNSRCETVCLLDRKLPTYVVRVWGLQMEGADAATLHLSAPTSGGTSARFPTSRWLFFTSREGKKTTQTSRIKIRAGGGVQPRWADPPLPEEERAPAWGT